MRSGMVKPFWMKASITVDNKSLEESLKQLIADRQKVRELEEVKEKLKDATKEINRLKEILSKIKQVKKQIDYNKEVNDLGSADYFYKANEKSHQQDYRGAVGDFNKVIELDPRNTNTYNNRGLAKLNLHDYRGAVEDFNKVIELDPKMNIDSNRGHAKFNLQDLPRSSGRL